MGIENDEIVIGLFANFRKQKNHELLLRAIKILKDRGINNIKVVFAGDGQEREKIDELIHIWVYLMSFFLECVKISRTDEYD